MAKAELEAAIADLGITMTATFVPWSKSRNFKEGGKPDDRSLNWNVSVKVMAKIDGEFKEGSARTILNTQYSAGIAHCPSYKQGARWTLDYAGAIEYETEHGKTAKEFHTLRAIVGGKPILPDTVDVIASLVLDASVIDHSSFEDWASEYGYDPDSRKAEKIYDACMNTALRLRNGIGEAGLTKLREAAQDY